MPDMAIQLTQKNIDDIIKQVEKLQQLAKAGIDEAKKQGDFLTPQEQEQQKLFEAYERIEQGLRDEEQQLHRHPSGTDIAVFSKSLIKRYKSSL